MKTLHVSVIICLTLSGCAPTAFLLNEPVDGVSARREVIVKQVDSGNGAFSVYKFNDDYAVVPKTHASSGVMGRINAAVIFSPKQLEELRLVIGQIMDVYDQDGVGEVQILEYHLTASEARLMSHSYVVASGGVASKATRVDEVQRVVFRLQFVRDSLSSRGPSRSIGYLFDGRAGRMSMDDLRTLQGDLNK